MISVVFASFLMMYLDETFRKASLGYDMTPSPAASGTSLSSKTSGRDLEDRWSLDKLPDVGS